MKITVDAMIPSSRLVPTSLNKGRPVVLDEPNSDVSTAIRQLAARFTSQFDAAGPTPSWSTRTATARSPRRRSASVFSRTAS